MNRYDIEVTCQAKGITADDLDSKFEEIADAVYDLTDVIDADLGANIGELTLDFTMTIDAADEPAALTKALAAVRCALHASGGSTPGWERHFEAIRQELIKQEPAPA